MALYFAHHAKDLSDTNADTAAKLIQELDPSTQDDSKPKPFLQLPAMANPSPQSVSTFRPRQR